MKRRGATSALMTELTFLVRDFHPLLPKQNNKTKQSADDICLIYNDMFQWWWDIEPGNKSENIYVDRNTSCVSP